MSPLPGSRVGPYEIKELLGAGGMGEVYRARDARLQREVAIKVLPAIVASDPQRLARFEREAQLLASLNHPNIAAIYGVEEAGTAPALVLELVEGPTLADRMAGVAVSSGGARPGSGRAGAISPPGTRTSDQGPGEGLPLSECLPIARQIADALDHAHARGIVHRDLKPANVKITPEGAVKVLDFGLAKALAADPGSSAGLDVTSPPTISAHATQAGMLLGTPAYMAPEQARGQAVDKRADIWAFGCLLFEMLTGRRAFAADTVSDTLAAVLTSDPPWQSLPPETPPAVRRLLRRTLERDVTRRLRDIADARFELDETKDEAGATSMSGLSGQLAATGERGRRHRRLSALAWGAGACLLAAIAAAGAWALKPAAPLVVRRVQIVNHEGEPGDPLISPSGSLVFFRAGGKGWLRDLRTWDVRELPGMDGTTGTFWSPDSRSIGYVKDNAIWTRTVPDGKEAAVAPLPEKSTAFDATWTEDDTIVFTTEAGPLYGVPSAGGRVGTLYPAAPPDVVDYHTPSRLPGGAGLLVSIHRPTGQDAIAVVSARGRKLIFQRPGEMLGRCIYSRTGHLLFEVLRGRVGLWAVPFSLSRLETTGDAYPLDGDEVVGQSLSESADGTLAYLASRPQPRRLVWLNRKGEEIGTVETPHHQMFEPLLSPDGRRLAIAVEDALGNSVWIYDLERGTRTRLATGVPQLWRGPDRVVVSAGEKGLLELQADGSGGERVLVKGAGNNASLSADGRILAFALPIAQRGNALLYWMDLTKGSPPVAFGESQGPGGWPRLSPDGHFVVYDSARSGRPEAYLTRFPSGEGLWPLSTDGISGPARWTPDGSEIIFSSGGWLVSVTVREEGGSPVLGKAQRLFQTGLAGWAFSVTSDGRLIAAVPVDQPGGGTELRLVFNCAAEPPSR